MAEDKKPVSDPNAFIKEYGPIAEKIGAEIGVDPKIILAKFGLETGWGRAVIPGTYNLGNIKDPSGQGVRAYDKKEKSNDAYMKFEDPDTFAAYYSDFIRRLYPKAVGTGTDVDAFTTGLGQGVRGSYASAEDYAPAIRNAYSLVNARMESMKPEDNPFGSGPTEADRMRTEGFGDNAPPPPPGSDETTSGMSREDAALYGAGAGLIAGRVAQGSRLPTPPRLQAAQEKYQVALDKLREAQANGPFLVSATDLENELKIRQAAANSAADELRLAQEELRATSRTPAAPATSVADDAAAASRKVAGSSGSANWARVMSDEIPDVVAETATSMRKGEEKGAQALIDKDVAARKKLQGMGLGDYELSGRGQTQLALPRDVAGERAAAMEAELAERQAREAAERTRLAQQEEARRIAAQQRVEAARQARQRAGEARREADQAARQARTAQTTIERAQSGANVAGEALKRAQEAQPGALARVGEATAKVAPKALGVISGAATGMSAYEAIERYKKGDVSGAVLSTLEATMGVLSMLPPAHPVLAALRGIGTVGGLGLAAYEGYRAVKGEPPPSANYEAP
jgi:hypothetical protein